MKLVYYAHCIGLYNTEQEKRDIETLISLGFQIYNPNSPECTEGYKKEGMDYFKRFASECDAIAFRSLPDGSVPAGVAKEIDFFQLQKKPVFELPTAVLKRTISVELTREYLKEVGYR